MPHLGYHGTLSSARAGVYKRVFRTQSPEELTGALLWNQAVAMALHPLITSFEVTLRNRLHVSLSKQASKAAGAVSESFPWYDPNHNWLHLQGETGAKVHRLLNDEGGNRLAIQPSPERVVSALSFGVWTNILDSQLPTPAVEAATFFDVFPHYPVKKPQKHWGFTANRKVVVERVKDVRAWRNRLSHCKPVWSEGWFRSSPNQHWQSMLARVCSRRQQLEETLSWMCPDTLQVCQQGFSGRLWSHLATDEAVFSFVNEHLAASWGPNPPAFDPAAFANYKARP